MERIAGQLITREQDVGDVLAEGALEGLKAEADKFPHISLPRVGLVGCQERLQALLMGVVRALN